MARLSDVFLSEILFSYNSAVFNCLGFSHFIQDSTENELCFLKSFSKNSSAIAKDEVREKDRSLASVKQNQNPFTTI